MGTPNYYRFSLKNEAGHYYYLSGGSVLTAPTKRSLNYGPDGWIEEGIRFERSRKNHGIFRGYSEELTFVKDGATILRHVGVTYGTEGKLFLEVERRRNDTWEYEPYFEGRIELPLMEGQPYGVSAGTKDAGLTAILKNNENIEYDIDLSTDTFNILHDGVNLKNVAYFSASANFFNTTTIARQFSPYLDNYFNDGEIVRDIFSRPNLDTDVANGTIGADAGIIPQRSYIYQSSVANFATIRFRGHIEAANSGATSLDTNFRVVAKVTDEDNLTLSNVVLFEDPAWDNSGQLNIYDLDVSATINLSANVRITLLIGRWPFGSGSSGNIQASVSDATLTLDYMLRLPTSTIKAFPLVTAFDKTIKKMGGTQYGVVSTLLNSNTPIYDNRPRSTFITGGDAVRNADLPIMKSSLSRLFDSADAIYGIGMGPEGDNVRIERAGFFYDKNNKIVSLGEVKDLTWSWDQESLFNLIKVGYNVDQYNKLNGREDWNTLFQYLTPLESVLATKEWISDARADVFGIEEVRGSLSQKKSTDSQADGDLFLFSVNPIPTGDNYTLARPQNNPGGIMLGVTSPETMYNVDLSVGHNMRRLAPIWKSSMYAQTGASVRFNTADRNKSVVSNLGSGVIIEQLDIPVSVGEPALWLPIKFNFTSPVPRNFNTRMSVVPYGYVDLIWRGTLWKMFIDKGGQIDAEKHTYEFEGRLTPDNDLTKLIY